ncbi:hypothetical protein RHSIM_Rhsim07G0081000 [Rhododendron simsii]|uniref:RING-type E3 ubiquitin transferase n=1 Tax=Rhododendron simsii TaxID=118357 RepID=A0A834GRK3_RHOSS|nr:hypothetical protein RHSIM_Rhsim07G0081000 [Rhododendron simsii]
MVYPSSSTYFTEPKSMAALKKHCKQTMSFLAVRRHYICNFLKLESVIGLKGNNKQKLPVILFDEDIRTREPMCCVCLGEFELKEELNQIPTCKHVFHIDCIRFWVHSNPTCPLCRSFIGLPTNRAHAPVGPDPIGQGNRDSNPNPQMVYQEHLQEQQTGRLDADVGNDSRIHDEMEGSSSSIGIESTCMENEMGTCSHQDYVVVTIHTHNS